MISSIVNIQEIKNLTEGDSELFHSIISSFVFQMIENLKVLESFDGSDKTRLFDVLHKMKGTFSHFGMYSQKRLIEEMELNKENPDFNLGINLNRIIRDTYLAIDELTPLIKQ